MVFVAESVITEIIPIGNLHLVFDLLSPHILVIFFVGGGMFSLFFCKIIKYRVILVKMRSKLIRVKF